MIINKVLLFFSLKKTVPESGVDAVCRKLADADILFERFDATQPVPKFDAVIALGGDGTMLAASRLAWTHNKPVLGINFGNLGYMSGLEISELNMLDSLKTGFTTERRMLIDITVSRGNNVIARDTALNEAAVTRKVGGGIASLDLKCDGTRVCSYRADGLIIATPTGSSAYALSAGGPIIDTKLDAFCVCAVCPHTLGTRALVFSPNSCLDAVICPRNGTDCLLTADGRVVCELSEGDIVTATRSEKSLELIRLKKDTFYDVLYRKLS